MANNNLHGYTPKNSNQKREKMSGTTSINNRLDRFNPYEFRKGMDFELTSMGVSRLAESTPKEREKATEKVIKNLGKHDGYYTSFITYETTYRNATRKPSFTKWLQEQGETENMKPAEKFNRKGKRTSLVALKEAIKNEIRTLIEAKKDKKNENDEEEPSNKTIKKQTGVEKSIADTASVLQQAKSELPALKKYFNDIKNSIESDVTTLKGKLDNGDISQSDYDIQYQGINSKLKNDQKVQSYVKFRKLLKDAGLLNTNETY